MIFKIQNIHKITSLNQNRNPEWEVDTFETTVKMSTYLVAFVISDFAKLGNSSNKGIRVEVAGRPESINKGLANYVLSEAMQIIDFFADYFDVPYPLEKSSKTKKGDFVFFH